MYGLQRWVGDKYRTTRVESTRKVLETRVRKNKKNEKF